MKELSEEEYRCRMKEAPGKYGFVAKLESSVFDKPIAGTLKFLVVFGAISLVQIPQLWLLLVSSILTLICSYRALGVMLGLFLAYWPTYWGEPYLYSRRWLKSGNLIAEYIGNYFDLHIVRESKLQLSSENKHIFGYSPHGLIPMVVLYGPSTSAWRKAFPEIKPNGMTSSIIHFVPLLRDCAQWLGALEASRKGFKSALRNNNSIFVVPGGQHEMLLGIRFPDRCAISTKHKGFIRLALRRAALDHQGLNYYIVPTFGFGEERQFANPLFSANIQEACLKRFRNNFTFIPLGRYYVPSLPMKAKLTLVIGEPILVPKLDQELPSERQVELLHSLYYSELRRLFDKYKFYHNEGYERKRVVFFPDLEVISRKEFNELWKATLPTPVPLRISLLKEERRENLEVVDNHWLELAITFAFALSAISIPFIFLTL